MLLMAECVCSPLMGRASGDGKPRHILRMPVREKHPALPASESILRKKLSSRDTKRTFHECRLDPH